MNLALILNLLAGILPLAHSAILTVEAMFPNAKAGAQKLDAAVSIISTALPAIGATADQATAVVSAAKAIITPMVAIMNASGVLKTSTPPASS